MSQRKVLPGKFIWFDLSTTQAPKAQAFYGEVLGWKAREFPPGSGYDMIFLDETPGSMIGGYSTPGPTERAQWMSYVSVDDVDAAARAAGHHGGKVIEPPADLPGAGRMARIADPLGAELCLFRKATDDPADVDEVRPGGWMWNELHTPDPPGAVSFYEKVIGYSSRALDMGPAGTYYILSHGGVDRAGVTAHLAPGIAPHWLPYVEVDDADATVAQARKLGAKIPMAPEDIPGIGRFGIIEDPTGGVIAVMKSLPREQVKKP